MNDGVNTLPALLNMVWTQLERGAGNAQVPARLVVLASVDAQGGPRARMVALRAADRTGASLKIHTDASTQKVRELRANPQTEIHVWIEPVQLQIRLHGTASILTGTQVAGDWSRVPKTSRGNFGVSPAPGTPIPEATAFERLPDREKFAVIDVRLDEIDVVQLSEPVHRRALYTRADGWAGQWLAP